MSKNREDENLGMMTSEDRNILIAETERSIEQNVNILAGFEKDSKKQKNIISSGNMSEEQAKLRQGAEAYAKEDALYINIYTKRVIAYKKLLAMLVKK